VGLLCSQFIPMSTAKSDTSPTSRVDANKSDEEDSEELSDNGYGDETKMITSDSKGTSSSTDDDDEDDDSDDDIGEEEDEIKHINKIPTVVKSGPTNNNVRRTYTNDIINGSFKDKQVGPLFDNLAVRAERMNIIPSILGLSSSPSSLFGMK
jgi:hypothetical protein